MLSRFIIKNEFSILYVHNLFYKIFSPHQSDLRVADAQRDSQIAPSGFEVGSIFRIITDQLNSSYLEQCLK